jgi:aspartyl protease family protein
MRGPLIVVAIIAALVLALSMIFPEKLRGAADSGALVALIQMTMVGILIGSGLFGSRHEAQLGRGKAVIFGAIWIGIALFMVAVYSQRDGFERLWANVIGEINPSAAQSNGQEVTLRKSDDGHYWAEVMINGQPIRMIVDTGASSISLDPADARRAGLDTDALTFNIPTSTAAGPSRAAAISLQSVRIGSIVRDDVDAMVMQQSSGVSLLGMSFLNELTQVQARGDVLTLTE